MLHNLMLRQQMCQTGPYRVIKRQPFVVALLVNPLHVSQSRLCRCKRPCTHVSNQGHATSPPPVHPTACCNPAIQGDCCNSAAVNSSQVLRIMHIYVLPPSPKLES